MPDQMMCSFARCNALKLRPPLKVHGGKYYLARQIIAELPHLSHFCEPFAGGASVLLNLVPEDWKRRCQNDLDPKRANLFLVLRDRSEEFIALLEEISYCRESFEEAKNHDELRLPFDPITCNDAMNAAVDYFVRMRMSRGGLGTAFAWSERLRGGQPGDLNAWCTMRDGDSGLRAISLQVQGVEITCSDACDLLAAWGQDSSFLFYLDPPYMHTTRTATKAYGSFEIDTAKHRQIAELANNAQAAIAISGYDSEEYNFWFKDWKRIAWEMPVHAGQSSRKRYKIEVLWLNAHKWQTSIH